MLKKFASAIDNTLPVGCILLYENDGVPILSTLKEVRKGRFFIFNDRGKELEIDPKRTYRLGRPLLQLSEKSSEVLVQLANIRKVATELEAQVSLADLWEILVAETKEFSPPELAELCFGTNKTNGPDQVCYILAAWLALLSDKIFFKRTKEHFLPRNVDAVAALKLEKQRSIEKEQVRQTILAELQNSESNPANTSDITKRALLQLKRLATGYELEQSHYKDACELALLVANHFFKDFSGRPEDAALEVLDHLRIFNKRTNIYLIRHDVSVHFTQAELTSAANLHLNCPERLDLTHLEAFTVDDPSTLDMDDALSWNAIGHGYQLGIHISDVSSFINPDSQLFQTALGRATSLYFPDRVVSMLPELLSHELLSLKVGEKRATISYLIEFSSDLKFIGYKIVPAYIVSRRRLSYEELDQLMDHGDETTSQLNCVAHSHESERTQSGANRISKREAIVKISQGGALELSEFDESSPARNLVAELMVMANKLSAEYAIGHEASMIFRGQEQNTDDETSTEKVADGPARDYAIRTRLKRSICSSIAAPHATLGLKAYAQLTSPIRRVHDLINQHQLRSLIVNETPLFGPEQISELIHSCDRTLSIANIVNRESKRFWLLSYLEQQRNLGETYVEGVVTRTDLKNPIIEVEGVYLPLPVRVRSPVKVGSRVKARITALDARREIVRLEAVD